MTPYTMVGYALNVAIAASAFRHSIPLKFLAPWACTALGLSFLIFSRSIATPKQQGLKARATVNGRISLLFAVSLALPWSVLATTWVAVADPDINQVLLLTFAVGMAASGSLILAPIPLAAGVYVGTILLPLILKLLYTGEREFAALAGLATSFALFLSALIFVSHRIFMERLQLTERLREALSEAKHARLVAERATAAKSEFFATMSHEIRTPLTSIIGYASLILARRGLSGDDARDMETLQAAGNSLLGTVNDILDFSALEAGRMKLTRAPANFGAIAEECAGMMAVQVRSKDIDLFFDVDPQLHQIPVLIDAQRVSQVLINLVSNAVKFTSEGRVNVVVRGIARTGDAIACRFSVHDTGPGISEQSIPQLFNRFSRLDDALDRRFAGSGLGLAICKSIVDTMNGKIGVRSTVGHGSTFWFDLTAPIVKSGGADAEPEANSKRRECWAMNVLVVDDIEPNKRLTATVLRNAGHRVVTAASGYEAIELARGEKFDAILMDMQMPGMNGLIATREIRKLPGHDAVPVIAMTANVLATEIASCYAAGMTGHIGKPFEIDELLRTVESAGRSVVHELRDPVHRTSRSSATY